MSHSSKPPDAAPDGPLIALIAGEPSGDLLGARLMTALKEATGGRVRFVGVGGEAMTEAGLTSFFPLSDIAVMGLVEVVPHLPRILRRMNDTADRIAALKPDALVTIDAPDFSLRVSRRLGGQGITRIHYVAPSVWAWKPGRAKKIAGFVDHLLTLLPFEPPYFEVHGLPTTFIGHPAVEAAERGDGPAFRVRHGIAPDATVVAMLPGSRRGEIGRHLPIFRRTLERLRAAHENLAVVVPTVETVRHRVETAVERWPGAVTVVGPDEKHDAFAASDVALAASGTVSVELGVAGVPTIVTYKLAWATAGLVALMKRVDYVSPINLVIDAGAQPEYLQHRATPSKLADAVGALLADPAARDAQRVATRDGLTRMGLGEERPSLRAARVVLAAIEAGPASEKPYTAPVPDAPQASPSAATGAPPTDAGQSNMKLGRT